MTNCIIPPHVGTNGALVRRPNGRLFPNHLSVATIFHTLICHAGTWLQVNVVRLCCVSFYTWMLTRNLSKAAILSLWKTAFLAFSPIVHQIPDSIPLIMGKWDQLARSSPDLSGYFWRPILWARIISSTNVGACAPHTARAGSEFVKPRGKGSREKMRSLWLW